MAENIKSNVHIADDVILTIAEIATNSVDGVIKIGEGMANKAMSFMNASNNNGIEIEKEADGKNLLIRISVVLRQGSELKKICYNIQEKVKENIESMLDLNVREVSVRVSRIVEG